MRNTVVLIGSICLGAGAILGLIWLFRCQSNSKEIKLIQAMKIRPAQVAGAFYPADKTELQNQVSELLNSAQKLEIKNSKLIILIVPHAGYIYSGSIAAAGFKQIEGRSIHRVILIGPSHQSWFEGAAVDQNDAWETPLDKVFVDRDWAKKIIDPENKIIFSSDPHLPEHCLEVELPFLQSTLTEFKIVPILLGMADEQTLTVLAEKIAQNLDEQTLLVVSTDLSHYPNYEIAQQVDQKTIEAILSGDPVKFDQTITQQMAVGYPNLDTCACGAKAVKAGLLAAQKLGQGEWRLIKYLNSGDTAGDKGRVVGYAAIAFYSKSKGKNQPADSSTVSAGRSSKPQLKSQKLTEEQKQQLLKIARESLAAYLAGKGLAQYQIDDPVLNQKLGVFVTLKKNGQLRGCMGNFYPETPLWQTVQKQAIIAATEDPRFPPVTQDELNQLEIEISVLSKPEKIDDWRQIKLGKHGVIIRRGLHSGTFLPQVARETGWDLETFLSVLCQQKAGLSADCYQDPATEIFVYTTETFSSK